MAVSLKKKVQNYTIDQGATFEKTIGAENNSSALALIRITSSPTDVASENTIGDPAV